MHSALRGSCKRHVRSTPSHSRSKTMVSLGPRSPPCGPTGILASPPTRLTCPRLRHQRAVCWGTSRLPSSPQRCAGIWRADPPFLSFPFFTCAAAAGMVLVHCTDFRRTLFPVVLFSCGLVDVGHCRPLACNENSIVCTKSMVSNSLYHNLFFPVYCSWRSGPKTKMSPLAKACHKFLTYFY